MRLTDIVELAAREGTRRFVEKRAGIALPLAVGASIPGIVDKAVERSRSTEHKLESAEGKPFKTAALPPQFALPLAQMMQSFGKNVGGPVKNMGTNMATGKSLANAGGHLGDAIGGNLGQIAGAPGKGIANGLSDMVQKKLFGQEIGNRNDAMGVAGGAALKSFGSEIGKSSVGLLKDIAMKAMDAVGHAGDQSAREAILGELKRSDSVLAQADDTLLMESYHTMQRFAPTLSTDKNAVRSFLRQAVMSGSGPDFMTIKHLADSERAVTGEKRAVDWSAVLRGAAVPAAGGAIAGAIGDDDNRLRGALTGGLLGGAVGGVSHGLQSMRTPRAAQTPTPDHRNQGPLPPKATPAASHLPFEGMTYLDTPGQTSRQIPMGVAPAAYELKAYTPEEALAHQMARRSYTGD